MARPPASFAANGRIEPRRANAARPGRPRHGAVPIGEREPNGTAEPPHSRTWAWPRGTAVGLVSSRTAMRARRDASAVAVGAPDDHGGRASCSCRVDRLGLPPAWRAASRGRSAPRRRRRDRLGPPPAWRAPLWRTVHGTCARSRETSASTEPRRGRLDRAAGAGASTSVQAPVGFQASRPTFAKSLKSLEAPERALPPGSALFSREVGRSGMPPRWKGAAHRSGADEHALFSVEMAQPRLFTPKLWVRKKGKFLRRS